MALIAAATTISAQHYDVETQKKIWKKMVADTVTTSSDTPLLLTSEAAKTKKEAELESYMPSAFSEYAWGLHRGWNASINLSAFATFGKNVPHHGGFGQNINFSYLDTLTKDGKLWVNIGGYLNNTIYGGDSYRDAGVYGMLGYKFNEHWETYVYGQLSLANNYSNYWNRYAGYYGYGGYPYGYGLMGYYPGYYGWGNTMGTGMGVPGANVIGAGVKYTAKSFSIGLNVEGVWYNNNNRHDYWGQYNYPVPGD